PRRPARRRPHPPAMARGRRGGPGGRPVGNPDLPRPGRLPDLPGGPGDVLGRVVALGEPVSRLPDARRAVPGAVPEPRPGRRAPPRGAEPRGGGGPPSSPPGRRPPAGGSPPVFGGGPLPPRTYPRGRGGPPPTPQGDPPDPGRRPGLRPRLCRPLQRRR